LAQAPVGGTLQEYGPQVPALAAAGPDIYGGPKIWGTIPPPKPLPYGYWWGEYQGADIEHPLYAPRHPHYFQPIAPPPNLLANFSCWFHKLFRSKPSANTATCDVCQTPNVPLPPVPSLAPVLPADPPLASEPLEPAAPYTAPAPPLHAAPPPTLSATPPATTDVPPTTIVSPPTVTTAPPATTIAPPAVTIAPPATSAAPPAIIAAPLPETQLPETQPAPEATVTAPAIQRQPPATTTRPSPEPTMITEIEPMPIDPAAAGEAQLPGTRTPVVELAPEFPMPLEQPAPGLAPRNVIPTPAQSVPRNKIPPQKRGNFLLP
jgi:hypothetical protein